MTIFTVSTQSQLDSTLTQLKGGDTLQLATGNYSLVMSGKTFASNVTVTSLDPSSQAKLTWLKLSSTSNITFKNLDIGHTLGTGEGTDSALSKVWGGSNITFDTVHFYGSLDGDPRNDGTGINIGGVNGVSIVNSEFEQLGRGAVFGSSTNVTVKNNVFHDIRSDGIDFSSVKNVLIDGNSFTNFKRISSDHPDAIQFWTTNTTQASTDIIIRNNVVLQGSGDGMQGIFMRDELGTLPYERVTIENNFIYEQNMSNGITIMGGKDIIIRGNTVLSPGDDTVPVWIRAESIVGGSITKNLTDRFYTGSNSGVSITDNLLTASAGLSASLLTFANMPNITTSQLSVSGYGYVAPSSGGTTTTETDTGTGTNTGTTTGGTTTDGSSSGGTTTDGGGSTSGGSTKPRPEKSRGRKSMLASKTISESYQYSTSSFTAKTLVDTLPEMQSSAQATGPVSAFHPHSAASFVVAKTPIRRTAADVLIKPEASAYFAYRFAIFSGN